LYIGVTANLYSRVFEHKQGLGSRFTSRYKCKDLLYYEFFPFIEEAILREKQMKKWKRAWKDELIRSFNPRLKDLFAEVQDMQ